MCKHWPPFAVVSFFKLRPWKSLLVLLLLIFTIISTWVSTVAHWHPLLTPLDNSQLWVRVLSQKGFTKWALSQWKKIGSENHLSQLTETAERIFIYFTSSGIFSRLPNTWFVHTVFSLNQHQHYVSHFQKEYWSMKDEVPVKCRRNVKSDKKIHYVKSKCDCREWCESLRRGNINKFFEPTPDHVSTWCFKNCFSLDFNTVSHMFCYKNWL